MRQFYFHRIYPDTCHTKKNFLYNAIILDLVVILNFPVYPIHDI